MPNIQPENIELILVRHGQNIDNAKKILGGRRDLPLTDKGLKQAQYIAELLSGYFIKFDKKYTPNRIISSPLIRAVQTAKEIAKAFEISKIEKNELITERDFGKYSGLSSKKIEKLIKKTKDDYIENEHVTYFMGKNNSAETFPELILRAKQFKSKIKSSINEKPLIVVSHGDFGKMLFAVHYNLSWQETLEMDFHFRNIETLVLTRDKKIPYPPYLFSSI